MHSRGLGAMWIALALAYLVASSLGHRAAALAAMGLMAGLLVVTSGRPVAGLVLGAALAGIAMRWADEAALLAYAPPLAAFAFMAAFFGRTLRAGRVPFIVRIARMEHPDLPAEMERHARSLTVLWTACFVVLGGAALVLAFVVSFESWARWVNAAGYVVPGALFVGELAYRNRRYSQHRHGSLVHLVRITLVAIREEARASRIAEARR